MVELVTHRTRSTVHIFQSGLSCLLSVACSAVTCSAVACSVPPPAPQSDGAGGSTASSGGTTTGGAPPASAGGTGGQSTGHEPESVLVFTKTAGFRHSSISQGIFLFEYLAQNEGFSVINTEDASVFSETGLTSFDAVVFLNTTGDVLDAGQQIAFESWFQAGGGFVGIHAAADTEYDWPFYASVVGAQFQAHPHVQEASILVEDATHPATMGLPSPWVHQDEWYDYLTNPRAAVHVLLTVDEASYSGGTMGSDHPIAWYQEIHGGRSFYTGLGHTLEAYAEVEFQNHVWGGLSWALGRSTM